MFPRKRGTVHKTRIFGYGAFERTTDFKDLDKRQKLSHQLNVEKKSYIIYKKNNLINIKNNKIY